MNATINLKIQVRSTGDPDLDGKPLPWADLDNMPEFHSYAAASQWLVDNDMNRLMTRGLEFRIVPADQPCVYVAALERHVRQTTEAGVQ